MPLSMRDTASEAPMPEHSVKRLAASYTCSLGAVGVGQPE
jgi:hypothetical protein